MQPKQQITNHKKSVDRCTEYNITNRTGSVQTAHNKIRKK